MPTPQAVARSSAQTPKGRLRIDPVNNAASHLLPRTLERRAMCCRGTAAGTAGRDGAERNAACPAV
jgi:hypothetical protein